MDLKEGPRRALHDQLVEVLGEEAAEVLMDHLPPAGVSDLATKGDLVVLKKDLDVLESRLRGEISGLRVEMADRFAAQTRTFLTTQIALVIAVIGSMAGMTATLAH